MLPQSGRDSRNRPLRSIKNGACTFTITQDVCVAVPVDFGAVATVGDAYVSCLNASADDICTDCDKEPIVASDINV